MASIRDEILAAIEKKQSTPINLGQDFLLEMSKWITIVVFLTFSLIAFIFEIFLASSTEDDPYNKPVSTKENDDFFLDMEHMEHHHKDDSWLNHW